MFKSRKTFEQLTCDHAVRSDIRAKSVRAAAFTGTAGLADFGIRLGSTAILARLVLPEQFGLVMMVSAVMSVAEQLKDFGLSTATIQCKEITHERATNLFWLSVTLSLGVALILCAASPLISHFYNDQRLVLITCVLAGNFLFSGLMVQHQALLTRQLKLGHTSTIRFSSSVLSTAAAIALAWLDFGYWALIWREVIRSALLTAGMWIAFPWIPGLPFRATSIRPLISFGSHLTGANVLASFSASADRFLLGRFWGAAPVAIYRQAYQLLLVPMDQLLSPLFQVSQPGLSLLQSDAPRFRKFYLKLLTLVCFVTMPASVYIAVYSEELTLLLLGPRWIECAPILLILSFATFIRQPVGSAALILITRGQSRRYLNLTIAQQLSLILALCVGVNWGPRGVAVGELAATYLMIAPTLYYCIAGSPVTSRDILKIVGRAAGVSGAMAAGLLLYRHVEPSMPLPVTLLMGAMAAAIFFLGVWLMLPGGKSELIALRGDVTLALGQKLSATQSTPVVPPIPGGSDLPLRQPAPVTPKL